MKPNITNLDKERFIVHIYGGYPKKRGSIEEYYFALTENLNKKGFKSIFAFSQQPDNALVRQYEDLGARIVILPTTQKRIDIPVIFAHAKLYREVRPAIVNVVFGRIGFNSLFAARLAGVRGTIWTKGSFEEKGPFYHKVSQLRTFASLIYLEGCLAKKIITVSDALKRELILYHIQESKIHRIYRGINLDRFTHSQMTQFAFLNELGISNEDLIISCISQARPEKGLEYLIRAIPPVISRFPAFKLLIVGGGPLTDELIYLSKKLNVEKHILFCGIRNDVENIIAASLFTVLPSLTEGLPLVSLESLAGGKPVIASNVGGIPEVITNGVNGYLVPPKDEIAIADRVLMLLSNPDLLRKMRIACLKTAAGFDVRQGAAKTADLYIKMLNENK